MNHRGALKSQPPGYSFSTTVYDMFQMIFISAGELCFEDTGREGQPDDDRIRTLAPGDVLLLRHGSRFRLSSPSSGYGGVCYMDYEPVDPRQFGVSTAFSASDWLVELAGHMQFALSYPHVCTQETLALLARTISWQALDEVGAGAAGPADPGRAPSSDTLWSGRVRHLVQNTLYAEQREFREKMASLGLSYRQLSRHFRNDVGVPIKQYQIRERIREAGRLLRNTGLSITDIAFELHYASSQKFAAQFKAMTGMTPKEYRNVRA